MALIGGKNNNMKNVRRGAIGNISSAKSMSLGGFRLPSPMRLMRAVAPAAFMASAPTLLNASSFFMGSGHSIAKALATPGAFTKKYSPFSNQAITKSVGGVGALMRQTGSSLSPKNQILQRGTYHYNLKSNRQMNAISLKGNRLSS